MSGIGNAKQYSARPPRVAAIGARMGGDRAQVVFAEPTEISAFLRSHCE